MTNLHCTLESATLDTQPVAADFNLPKDGVLHTMSLGIVERGGVVLAVRSLRSDSYGEVTPADVLKKWCEAGHPG